MKNVLLIFDDNDMLKSFRSNLQVEGETKVSAARNRSDGIEHVTSKEYDLICIKHRHENVASYVIRAARGVNYNINTPIVYLVSNPAQAEIKNREFKNIHFLSDEEKLTSFQDFARSLLKLNPLKKEKNKYDYDPEFIKSFINAARITLKSLGSHDEIKHEKPYLLAANANVEDVDISGKLTMVSKFFRGTLYNSYPKQTFINIVSQMLGEKIDSPEEFSMTEDYFDVAGELTNMIYSQVNEELNAKGYDLEKAIPSVVAGKNKKLAISSTNPVVVIPMDSGHGRFYLLIAFNSF
jgi:chemotaxis protein CheX